MPRKGQATNLTPEIQEQIVSSLLKGNYRKVAARAAGISEMTVGRWMRRGLGTDPENPPEPIYTDFANAVLAAEAEAENRIVVFVYGKATDDVNVAMKFLMQRYANRWGNHPRIEEQDQEKDWIGEGVKLVQSGEVSIEQIREEFGEYAAKTIQEKMADGLFKNVAPAGVEVKEEVVKSDDD